MSTLNQFGLVCRREVIERLRSRSVQATTVFLFLVTLAVGLIVGVSATASRTHRLAVVGSMPPGLEQTAAHMASEMERTHIDVSTVPDLAAGRAALRAGRVDAVAVDLTHIVVLKDNGMANAQLVFSALRRAEITQRLQAAGLSSDEVDRLVASPTVKRLETAGVPTDRATELAAAAPKRVEVSVLRPFSIGSAVAALEAVFVVSFLFIYGMWIAQGVVEETTSGVSNIVIATCPPARFLVGKTVGIGLVGLAQAIVLMLPALLLLLTHPASLTVPASALLGALLWFTLAFGIYGHLFAAVGAWARRIDKVSGTTVWVSVPMVVFAFGGVMAVVLSPACRVAAFLSFFPPSAPFTMPARSAALHLAWWEVPLSAGAAAATAVAAALAGARLYKRGLSRA